MKHGTDLCYAAAMRVTLLAFALGCCAAVAHGQAVYKSVGPDGKVIYSDKPPDDKAKTVPNVRARAPQPEDDPVTASLMVYAQEVVVETAATFCAKEIPESAAAVYGARERWRERNGELAEKKIVVLKDMLSDAELRYIARDTQRDNEAIVWKLRDTPRAQKEQWCRDAPAKFASREMDLSTNTAIVKTIMGYKKKSP